MTESWTHNVHTYTDNIKLMYDAKFVSLYAKCALLFRVIFNHLRHKYM